MAFYVNMPVIPAEKRREETTDRPEPVWTQHRVGTVSSLSPDTTADISPDNETPLTLVTFVLTSSSIGNIRNTSWCLQGYARRSLKNIYILSGNLGNKMDNFLNFINLFNEKSIN